MQSTVMWMAVSCDRSNGDGCASSSVNVVAAPRPQNENGGPGSAFDCGLAGMLDFRMPLPAATANTSRRGRSSIVVTLPSVRRFMAHSPECVTQIFAL